MSVDIVLVNPPVSLAGFIRIGEPLGLCYLASALRNNGYQVKIIDANIQSMSLEQISSVIISESPYIVGLSCMTHNVRQCIQLARAIKKLCLDVHICIGGYLATVAHLNLLKDFQVIDSAIRGEGEETIVELADVLTSPIDEKKKGIRMEKIKGLTFRNPIDRKIHINPPRPLNSNLDSYPFPSRDFAREIYSKGISINISTSRGCYGKCIYCSVNCFYTHIPGPSWRARSPENVIEELSYLYHKYNFRKFFFVDDNFVGPSPKRVMNIAKLIIKEGLDIEYVVQFRPNDCYYLNLKLLRKSGLKCVYLGIESFFEPTLRKFKRGLSLNDNIRAINLLKENNIFPILGFIFFHPWLSMKEIYINLKFLERFIDYFDHNFYWNTLGAHWGTELWSMLKEKGDLNGRYNEFGKYMPIWKFYDANISKIARWVYRYVLEGAAKVDALLEESYYKFLKLNNIAMLNSWKDIRKNVRKNHIDYIKEITNAVMSGNECTLSQILERRINNLNKLLNKLKVVYL